MIFPFFVARDSENSFNTLLLGKPEGELLKVQENFSNTDSSFQRKPDQNKANFLTSPYLTRSTSPPGTNQGFNL